MDELQQQIVALQNDIEYLKSIANKGKYSNTVIQNKTVIQSTGEMISPGFVAGVSGWSLGSDGILQARGATLAGTITAGSGAIGGWTINADSISKSVIKLDAANDQITVGTNKVILDTDGITAIAGNIGGWTIDSTALSTGAYDTVNTMYFGTSGLSLSDTFKVTAAGALTAKSGLIGGWNIDADSLYASTTGTIKTGINVGLGYNGVIMDKDGLRGYDSILGKVFDLPSNGDAPTFSSGIINETIFEISTNSVLRTSSTTGDGTVNSAGVLINNTGIYGLVANQTPATANVRILNQGTAYFGNTSNYMHWDGQYLKLKGSFDVGVGGVINNSSYTVANLPVQPTAVGYSNPSGIN